MEFDHDPLMVSYYLLHILVDFYPCQTSWFVFIYIIQWGSNMKHVLHLGYAVWIQKKKEEKKEKKIVVLDCLFSIVLSQCGQQV